MELTQTRAEAQAAKTRIPRAKYPIGTNRILLVSANQSAAVSITAIDILRFLKQQIMQI